MSGIVNGIYTGANQGIFDGGNTGIGNGVGLGLQVENILPNAIVRNGLVLYLDASQNYSYPRSGTTWRDISGNNNNGTLTNGPTFNSGNGGSIVFDGTNDTTNFGNILNIGLNSWTMSCWVRFTTGAGIFGIIGKTSARSYIGRYAFYVESGNLNALFQPSGAVVTINISTPVAPFVDGKFHNLSMTINRTGFFTLYVDGVSYGTPVNISSTSNVNLNQSTDFLYIGSYATATGQVPTFFFNGRIASAQIYNRALSEAEITQNYNATRGRFGL